MNRLEEGDAEPAAFARRRADHSVAEPVLVVGAAREHEELVRPAYEQELLDHPDQAERGDQGGDAAGDDREEKLQAAFLGS
ncbi:MAG: hypothetical protein COA65_10490 [Rhodospirillaceae bacterium]|nr:MAG: hypothetical protein COA65_10490 [Rhodospirillaceae bacterium]